MCTGSDVEENHFIGPLFIVAHGQFHRISDISQFSCFGSAKLNASSDLAVMDIEAGDDASCEHATGHTSWSDTFPAKKQLRDPEWHS